jgi:putative membrane protein
VSRINSFSKLSLVAGAVLVSALACKPATDRTTGTIGSPRDTSLATTPAPLPADTATAGATAGAALTDPNIVALLDEANKADSAAGALARTKASNPDVKAFAQLMITEHHMLRMKGQELAKKLNLSPQPPANDPVQAAAKSEMDALKSAPKGAQFDKIYIDQEVTIHKAVLDLAGQAHEATQNAELKQLIETAKPYLERHLERAEALQKKLGKPTA